MIRAVLILLALLPLAAAHAAPRPWTIHTVSMHYRDDGQYNNINPGIAYDMTRYTRVGAVVNSYYHLSTYAVGIIPVSDRLRIGAGMVTGYGSETRPMIAVEYDVRPGLSVLWFGTALNVEVKF